MKKFINSILLICVFSSAFIWGGGKLTAQCQNTFPLQGNTGIQTTNPQNALHIDSQNPACPDPSIRLSFTNEGNMLFWGFLALQNSFINPYSSISDAGDLVLHNSASPEQYTSDIVISNNDFGGGIHFTTTEEPIATDIERMTITTDGNVGITNLDPFNLFSVKLTTGLDFWNENLEFQDIRFNCYADSEARDGDNPRDTSGRDGRDQIYHKNILPGHSAIIQSKSSPTQGGLLLAVTQNYENPNTTIDFFETSGIYEHPKGILLQNYQFLTTNFTNIGIGSLTQMTSRVVIRGRTSDNTMNALRVINWESDNLFLIRNDGNVGIGVDNPQQKLVVDGTICSKEARVSLSGAPCWPDFVFDKNYKLMSLEELEKNVYKNRKLPGMPSSEEVIQNGIELGDMQAKLLQKIEELTLYVIQLKKEINILKKK